MANDYGKIISLLKELRICCLSISMGFHAVSKDVQNESFQDFLEGLSRQHQGMADEIKTLILRLGGNPRLPHNAVDGLRRDWDIVRPAVQNGDESTILGECERKEDEALDLYRKVLSADVPAQIRRTVHRQYLAVDLADSTLHALRDNDEDPARIFEDYPWKEFGGWAGGPLKTLD